MSKFKEAIALQEVAYIIRKRSCGSCTLDLERAEKVLMDCIEQLSRNDENKHFPRSLLYEEILRKEIKRLEEENWKLRKVPKGARSLTWPIDRKKSLKIEIIDNQLSAEENMRSGNKMK